MSAIQQLHDAEINGGLSWPEQGKILVYLGCPLDPPPRKRMFGEALVDSFAEADAWLRGRGEELCRGTFTAGRAMKPVRSVIDRLFAAGVPGSVYWVYDSAFAVTRGDLIASATSWAEVERWLAAHAAE